MYFGPDFQRCRLLRYVISICFTIFEKFDIDEFLRIEIKFLCYISRSHARVAT